MTDFRFQFLQRDFPALAALCEQAERADDLHTALLKMRMALENMVNDMGAKQKELFGKINELNDQGILDAKRSQLFHQVRRTSNLGVHEGNEIGTADIKACLDALFEITLWYAISFKKKHYELAAFQTADMGLAKQYLNDHAPKGEKSASSEQAQDFFSNSIDPLQIEGDFSQLLEKNEETDELEQDVFETDEEYAERIASLPKVHLGYAILDTRRQDGYTKIVFPLHHIDRNDRIHFSNNIRAFYAEDITGDDVIDDELVGGLRVFDGQVYCNYSTIVLKHGNEEIPLHPICWEKFPYETDMDLQHRIAQMPVLPLGLCMPDRNSYDLYTQTLTFAIKPFVYVKEKLTSSSINLEIDRDVAKELCAQSHPYKLFGQFKNNDVSFILWDKELGVFYTDSEEMQRYRNNPNSMGYMYAHGRGVKRDYKKAMEWYQKAANQGDAVAKNNIGDLYYFGRGVKQDYQEAMKWYQQAAKQGNAAAQHNIGYLYECGNGVNQDYQEAMKWYRKASERGSNAAKENLTQLQKQLSSIDVSRTKSSACPVNSYGVQKDCEEDMQKYRKAAEQGDADAQNSMGDLYYWGRGVLRDYKEAMKWYRKAAEQGNTDAQYKIGNLYCFGQGVMTDYQEAMKWYRKAADQDSADAQNIIGYLYECGNGVEQDYQEALKWYRKASEHGNDSAKRKLVWLQHFTTFEA